MAKTLCGDWRNPDRIPTWAAELAAELPTAMPGRSIEHPARSASRLLAHAIAGWALCAVSKAALLSLVDLSAALVVHAIVAPLFFIVIAWHYFGARGARDPLPTAVVWTAVVAVLDLTVLYAVQGSLEMFGSLTGFWLPCVLIFLATWITGVVMWMMPWRDQLDRKSSPAAAALVSRTGRGGSRPSL
jgi:hypothetical protein